MSRTPRSICECHCGTRIDINPKLVEEREAWREKCVALEENYRQDTAALKQKIYKECAQLMEKELKAQEQNLHNQTSKKNAEIHALNLKLQNTESKASSNGGEVDRLRVRLPELEDTIRQLEEKIEKMKRNHLEDIRHLQDSHHDETQALEREKNQIITKQRKANQAQLFHLRHQINDFENKYKVILPEVEKLRSLVNSKTIQNDELKKRLCDLQKQFDEKVAELNKKITQLRKPDLSHELRALQRELEEKNKELSKARTDRNRQTVKTEIKYQTVYVDRPVEIEKIVEKVVEVEKIVKEYVQPKQPLVINEVKCSDEEDKEDYDQILAELNNRTRFIAQLQNHLSQRDSELQDFERVVADYQRNIEKYKSQRVKLANTIGEKNRQIEALEQRLRNFMMQMNAQPANDEGKIIVNVRKDGTYSSTVERPGLQATRADTKKQTRKVDEKRGTVPVKRK